MSLPYKRFDIFACRMGQMIDDAFVGSVEAQSAEEAIFRLCGGEYGRTDYFATEQAEQRGYT